MDSAQLNHLRNLVHDCKWTDAWQVFEQLRNQGPPSPQLLLAGSHVAFGRRDLFRARQLGEAALTLCDQLHPTVLLGQVRFHLGIICRDLGDTHVALEQLQLFLAELPVHYPELSMGQGQAWFYLGLTLRQRRNLDGAVEAYYNAIRLFRDHGLPTYLCEGLQNLAWLLCCMERPDDARVCLNEAEELIVGKLVTHPQAHRIHQSLGEAFVAKITGDYAKAAQLCEDVFRRAERGEEVTAEQQSQAAWIAGMVALDQGNLESAEAMAQVALTYGTEAKDSRLINDAGALRRGIYLRRQAGA